MKFTKDWLQDHLKTNKTELQIIEKLNNIGLEVENIELSKNELSDFTVAKIVKSEKHPNADRLKLCKVDIGNGKIVDVVCGAPNARDNLVTIYAPPGSIIPKNQMKLQISKIRGITSYGMLCSGSELNLSSESEGIVELDRKYISKIGSPYFKNNDEKVLALAFKNNIFRNNNQEEKLILLLSNNILKIKKNLDLIKDQKILNGEFNFSL